MIAGLTTEWQALLATLFTWGVTAAGAALVFILRGGQRKILDVSLGFAAGVMLAASYWSLLAPAIDMVTEAYGPWSFVPVSVGFIAGGLFVYLADLFMNACGLSEDVIESIKKIEKNNNNSHKTNTSNEKHVVSAAARQRHKSFTREEKERLENEEEQERRKLSTDDNRLRKKSWKRILLMIIAITVHNIPEGLAVGVGFGAIGRSPLATFEKARNLAVGIALQNFPEGLAVSLPLNAAGIGPLKSFWYGQLSGMVEPLAGIFGAIAVTLAEPLLPYALAFAAGAMVYVVMDDIVPEGHTSGNGKLTSFGAMIGFVIMMSLDVGLG